MTQELKFLCFPYLMVYQLFIKARACKQSINKQIHSIAFIAFIHNILLYMYVGITTKTKEERKPRAYFICEQLESV
jgi:hypothetical protein